MNEVRKAPTIICNWYFVEQIGNPVDQVLHVLNPPKPIHMKEGYEYPWMGVRSFLNAKAWWQLVEIKKCSRTVYEFQGRGYQGYRIEFRHRPDIDLRSVESQVNADRNHQPLLHPNLRWRYA